MIDVVVVIWSLSVVIIMVKTTVDTHVAPGKKKGKKEGAEKDENEEDVFTNTVPRDFPEVRSPRERSVVNGLLPASLRSVSLLPSSWGFLPYRALA